MRGSIILFLIVVLVLSYGIGHHPIEKSVDDDADEDDDESEDDDDGNENSEEDFVGTNLFGDDCDPNKCFSSTDVALLMARKDFENLVPKDLPKCLLDDHLVEVIMKYFYSANQMIVKMSKGKSKRLVELAFYDTLGGYLQHYLIPVAKYSFYAGLVKLKTVVNIMQLFNQCKIFLNTNGNGWIGAICDFSEFNLEIEPIQILKNRNEKVCQSACANLILAGDDSEDDDMIVSLPKIEREEFGLLSNIWLPFKKKHHFNLRSHSSAFVLLRYYVLVTRCYQFQGVCQDTFNHKFKEWYEECIEMHLDDEILYPGLGAVLRIMETLRNRKKFAFMPHYQSERGSSKICPFTKTNSENSRLKSKVDKLSDQSKQTALKGPLNRGSSITGDIAMFDEDDSPSLKARRKKYITIAVLISLFLLVFILAVAVLTKYMSSKGIKCRKKKKHKDGAESDASGKSGKTKKDKKHEKEEKKKHDKEEKKHEKEEKKHEKEEKKKHEKEEKKKHEEEKKHEKEEKKKHEKEEKQKHEEEKKHEKEEKKKHEEEKKHEKEEKKKHEEEKKKHEKEAHKHGSSSDRKSGGSESSTSSASTSPTRSSRTSPPSPRKFFKGGLKLNLVDEKGRSKKFSISKKNKPIAGSSIALPSTKKRSNSMDSGGGTQLNKGALSTSWETIE